MPIFLDARFPPFKITFYSFVCSLYPSLHQNSEETKTPERLSTLWCFTEIIETIPHLPYPLLRKEGFSATITSKGSGRTPSVVLEILIDRSGAEQRGAYVIIRC